MFKFLRFAIFLHIALSSCISHKKTVYFQDKNSGLTIINDSATSLSNNIIYKVKPGDLLFISITSLNKEITEFYNLSSLEASGNTPYLALYSVNDSGYVTIPILGKIEAKGLSIEQIQNKVLQKVRQSVNDATVIVKLGDFKVIVLGEVKMPGIVHLEGEKGTIFDAIALSHDIDETGNRENVQIIRELDSGLKQIIILDLTDKRIINSKDIYLKPNDIVYVEPLKAKAKRNNLSQWTRFVGFTSILYLVYNLINRGIL